MTGYAVMRIELTGEDMTEAKRSKIFLENLADTISKVGISDEYRACRSVIGIIENILDGGTL